MLEKGKERYGVDKRVRFWAAFCSGIFPGLGLELESHDMNE
jgi:hypothetical protein